MAGGAKLLRFARLFQDSQPFGLMHWATGAASRGEAAGGLETVRPLRGFDPGGGGRNRRYGNNCRLQWGNRILPAQDGGVLTIA